jgi:hypothetical protein
MEEYQKKTTDQPNVTDNLVMDGIRTRNFSGDS